MMFLICNSICVPENFNMNILHQLFDNKITFVNSQLEDTNLKGDFVLINRFETFVSKISSMPKIDLTQIWYDEFNSLQTE